MLIILVFTFLGCTIVLGDTEDNQIDYVVIRNDVDTTCRAVAIPGYPEYFVSTRGVTWSVNRCPENTVFDHNACGCVQQNIEIVPLKPLVPVVPEIGTIPEITTTISTPTLPTASMKISPLQPPPPPPPPPPTTTTTSTTTPTTTTSLPQTAPICSKRPHKSDPKKYEEEIAGHGFIIRRCPAGTIFSQTACDCEIDTRPKRKRGLCDGCKFDRGVGYNEHITRCDKYIICYPDAKNQSNLIGVERQCDVGEYWDQDLMTCVSTVDAYCENDPCSQNSTLQMYPYDGNCRGYWICKYGISIGQCCPVGQSFKYGVGCIPDRSCHVSCTNTSPRLAKCDKKAVLSNPVEFKQLIVGHGYVTLHCAAGTIFNESLCECQTDNRQQQELVCKKEVDMDFEADVTSTADHRVHIGAVNVAHEAGSACFYGNSALIIPRYSNADIGERLEIRIKYKLKPVMNRKSADKLQALIYNGDCGPDSSIAVTVTPTRTVFGLRNSNNISKTLELNTYEQNYGWNFGVFTLQNEVMTIQQNGQFKKTYFKGAVAKSICGLKMGWGKGFESFRGCIDQLSISFCPT